MRGGTVSIRTAEEVAMARRAGHLAADVLGMIAEHIRPGITTDAIDHKRTVRKSTPRSAFGLRVRLPRFGHAREKSPPSLEEARLPLRL